MAAYAHPKYGPTIQNDASSSHVSLMGSQTVSDHPRVVRTPVGAQAAGMEVEIGRQRATYTSIHNIHVCHYYLSYDYHCCNQCYHYYYCCCHYDEDYSRDYSKLWSLLFSCTYIYTYIYVLCVYLFICLFIQAASDVEAPRHSGSDPECPTPTPCLRPPPRTVHGLQEPGLGVSFC